MSLHAHQVTFSRLFAHLVLYAGTLGYEAVINEVARTIEQQRLYVQQGKSQTMQSPHLTRLAGDLLLFKDGVYLTHGDDYTALGVWWKAQDPACRWGGDWSTFKDANHFEYHPQEDT